MALRANRRWLCRLTALLFAMSGVAHAYAMTDAAMKMPSAAMASAMSDQAMPDASMADHGMDCGGGDKAAHADCIAMCATAVAILSELVAVPFVVAMQDIVIAAELPPASGGPSPDPHPPKR
jgi:hypothetical protein